MKVSTSKTETRLIGICSAALLLLLWKLGSLRVNAEIILPPPEDVILRLFSIMKNRSFWLAVGATSARTLYGFLLSFAAGVAAGIAAGRSRRIDAVLSPVITVIRTVPVMAVILLAMIWFKTDTVPVFVCFLMIFPIITANVRQGVSGVSPRLLEMSKAYKVSRYDELTRIVIPSIVPYILSGLKSGIGVAWKSVIAAEVLSQPLRAIGTGLQFSQMNLETAEVMAWTVVAILFSWISETALDKAAARLKWRPS